MSSSLRAQKLTLTKAFEPMTSFFNGYRVASMSSSTRTQELFLIKAFEPVTSFLGGYRVVSNVFVDEDSETCFSQSRRASDFLFRQPQSC